MKKIHKSLISVLRILFVVGILSFMVIVLDPKELWEKLKTIRLPLFCMVFVFLSIEASLRSINWGQLLRCKGVDLPFRKIFYAYITGSFFGYFIPSSLGTDVSRFIALSKQTSIKMSDSAVTVVALNVVMLLSLALTAGLSAVGLAFVMTEKLPFILIAVAALSGILVFFLVLGHRETLRKRLTFSGKIQKGIDKIWKLIDAFTVFEQHTLMLLKVFGNAFLIQILATLNVYFISLSLQSEIPILYIFLFMPIIAITRMVPINIANLGAEQGIFVALFALVGVPPEEIFLISVLLSSASLLFILAGGLVYLFGESTKLSKPPASPPS